MIDCGGFFQAEDHTQFRDLYKCRVAICLVRQMNIMEIFSRMLLESWKAVYYKINTKASAKREEIICPPYPGWMGQYTDKVDNDNETLE